MKILWNQRESSLELVVVEEENVDQEEKSATITSDSTRLQSKDGSPEHHRGPFLTTASSSSSTSVQQLLGEVKGRGEKESEKCSGDNHFESDDNSSDDDDTSIASTIASDTSSTCSSSSSFGLEYEEEEEEEQDENDSNQEEKTTRNDKTKSVRFNLQANQIFPLVVRTNQQQEKGGAADQKEASAEEDKEEFPWNQRGNGSRWHSKYSLWWYDSIKGKGKLLRKNNRYSHHHCSNSHLARPNYQPSQQEQPQEPEDNHPPNNDWMDPHLIWYTSRELAQMRAQVIPDVSTFLVQDMPRAARCLRQLRRMYKECSKEYSYSGCDWNDHNDDKNTNNNTYQYAGPGDQDLEALLLHHGDDNDDDDRNHSPVLDDYDYKQQHERAAALAVDECQHQEEQAAVEDLLGIRQLLRDRFRLYVYDEENDMMEEEEHKNKPDIETGGGGMFEKNRHNNNNDDNDNDNDDDDGFSIISIVGIEELVMDLGESKRQARREGQRFLQEHQQRQQPQDDAEGEDEDEDEDEHSDWHCPERKLVLELEPNNDDDDIDSADPSHHRRPPRVPTTMFTAVSDASRTSSRFAHELALALAASLYPDKRSKTTN